MKYRPILDKLIERSSSKRSKAIQNNLAQMRGYATLLGSFENIVDVRHPDDTPEKHVKRISNGSKKLDERTRKFETESFNALGEAYRNVRQDALNIAGIVRGAENAAEIRIVFRSMSHTDRIKALGQRDPQILSAIVDENPFLTGIDQKIVDDHIQALLEDKAPDQVSELAEIEDYLEVISVVTKTGIKATNNANASSYVRNTLESMRQAEATHEDFLNQLQGG